MLIYECDDKPKQSLLRRVEFITRFTLGPIGRYNVAPISVDSGALFLGNGEVADPVFSWDAGLNLRSRRCSSQKCKFSPHLGSGEQLVTSDMTEHLQRTDLMEKWRVVK